MNVTRARAETRRVARITDQALWVSTVTLGAPELVSKRLGNHQFHPVWDLIADQAWVR